MIEVRIILLDPQEIQWYAQFVAAVLQHRGPVWTPAGPQPETPTMPNVENVPMAAEAEVIGHITPEGHTPTNAELEAALKTFYQAHGIAAARALLDEYGAKRVTDVKPEQRVELMGRLK